MIIDLIVSQVKVCEIRQFLELLAVWDFGDKVVGEVEWFDFSQIFKAFDYSDLVVREIDCMELLENLQVLDFREYVLVQVPGDKGWVE